MQTTLLGLAIAFIMALIAALVGPHFIDWNQFRPQFESEATRAMGAPVRVEGMLDARLLPTPTLRLRSVVVGGKNAAGQMSADKLDVEFSLGSLLRGEWRASELSLDGFALALGLDREGRVEGPLSLGRFNLGSLAIDRLNLAGRIKLHDAASGATLDVGDLKFGGDVRALAGTMRGEGSFTLLGVRTPFRVSSGQSTDGKGTRLRFIADPGGRALFADLDGVLTFDALIPKFDGVLTLTKSVDVKTSAVTDSGGGLSSSMPWRISSRVQANPASAILEQVDATYGPDDSALRLSGAGEIRFGAIPQGHVALSARQLDADRLLYKGAQSGGPLRLMSGLRRAVTMLPPTPLPVKIEISADQIALGGKPIQNLAVELRANTQAWTIGKFEMRAPGATRVSMTGAISPPGSTATFVGPVAIESTDPDSFIAWLQGRSDVSYRSQLLLRIRGVATIAADRIGIDALKADMDGGVMEGRVTFLEKSDGNTRLDAALKAESFNLDAANFAVSPLAGAQSDWPNEMKFSLDVARALLGGQEVRPVALEFSYGPQSISLDRLNMGEAGGVAINGSGYFNRDTVSGNLSLQASAPSLGQLGVLVEPISAAFANRLRAVKAMQGEARIKLSVDLDKTLDGSRPNARATVDIDVPQFKGVVTVTPLIDASRSFDLAALTRREMNVDAKLASAQSSTMLQLLGLGSAVSAQDGPAQFESSVVGKWRAPLKIKAKLFGTGFDGDIQGSADPWAEPPKANVSLTIRRADPSALFDLKPASVASFVLSSRLNMSGNAFAFDDLDAMIGGSRVRGNLSLLQNDEAEIKGALGIDTIDVPAMVALAVGATGRNPAEPLGRGLLRGWRGSVSFRALKAVLPGGAALLPFGGVLRSDGQSLVLDGIKGSVGGGDVAIDADARQIADGTSVNVRMQATDVDGADIRYRGLVMPEGKASFQVSLTTQGRSAAALSGALSGAGSVTIKDARIAGLDPRAFETAVRASDNGQATDDASLKSVVDPALVGGALSVAVAQISFNIKDGRLRVETTPLPAVGTRAFVSGGYDLASDQVDVRVVLSANVAKPETGRPDIRIDLNGSPDALLRNVDVAGLSPWLAMRAIDRETRKLDQLERGVASGSESLPMSLEGNLPKVDPIPSSDVKIPVRDPRRRNPNVKTLLPASSVPAVNAPPQVSAPHPSTRDPSAALSPVQPLPPPVNVRPAPGAPKMPKPRPPVVLTPPPSGTTSF